MPTHQKCYKFRTLDRINSNPSRDEGMGSNPGAGQKSDNRETPGSHDLGVARPPESVRGLGPKNLLQGGGGVLL